MSAPSLAVEVPLQHVSPSKARWRRPAWPIALRAFLAERDEFLRAQIHLLGLSVICRGAWLSGHSRSFVFVALSSSLLGNQDTFIGEVQIRFHSRASEIPYRTIDALWPALIGNARGSGRK
jgi:hypothetical protein